MIRLKRGAKTLAPAIAVAVLACGAGLGIHMKGESLSADLAKQEVTITENLANIDVVNADNKAKADAIEDALKSNKDLEKRLVSEEFVVVKEAK